MSQDKILYLSKQDVLDARVSMQEIIDALEAMFKEKGQGQVEMPPKPGIHTRPDAFIHAMPAYIPSLGSAGIKWISGYPENQQKGLPYINGLLILNDPQTGIPYTIMDGAWITAKRTAAASAVAARYMAREDSSTLGVIACGVQGRSHLEAFSCLYNLKKVKAFDIYPQVAEKFAKEMSEAFDVEIEVADAPQNAVQGMDLVVTSGPIVKNPQPIIKPDWLAEGSFTSLVDFDCMCTKEALQAVDIIATDDLNQLESFRKSGYFLMTPAVNLDLGDIVAGKRSGRNKDKERTVAINLGVALDDMATAPLVYKKALEKGLGTELSL